MPELRIDPLSGLRTVIAGERATRPGAFSSRIEQRPPLDPKHDPFLEGNEDRTPPEVFALRPDGSAADSPGWRVRVVPNLYPAFAAGGVGGPAGGADGPAGGGEPAGGGAGPADPLASGRGMPSLFASRPAVGAHEVVIHTPEPAQTLLELGAEQLAVAMDVWRRRMRAHDGASYVHVMVNEGASAGASLPHSHAQLYAMSFVPSQIARERERFTAYWERTQGRNLLADLLQEEVRGRERVVAIDDEAVALCPFAARMPFEFQIVPRVPRARFQDEGPLGAALLHGVLGRLESVLGGLPALNLWVRTAPAGADEFCWRIDVVPRLAQLAGLEMGTGLALNIVPPEVAAAQLRDAPV